LAVSLRPTCLSAQQTLADIFAQPTLSVPNIPKGVTDIEVDQEGNLYLLRPDQHRLIKRFKSSGYDSSQTIGGKGIGDEGFNFPTQICVPNRQSVFMLDYMNRRIVQFNTNLRVIDDVSFLTLDTDLADTEEGALWPISFCVGPTGEFFLLNQDDLRIYKLTSTGQLERAFAGLDYGQGSIKEPTALVINDGSVVFAIDTTYQESYLYDLYGTFLYRFAPVFPFRWHHLIPFGDAVLLIGQHGIFYYDLRTKEGDSVLLPGEDKILDLAIGRGYMYVLLEGRVDAYVIR
jgi:hypothetical protein